VFVRYFKRLREGGEEAIPPGTIVYERNLRMFFNNQVGADGADDDSDTVPHDVHGGERVPLNHTRSDKQGVPPRDNETAKTAQCL